MTLSNRSGATSRNKLHVNKTSPSSSEASTTARGAKRTGRQTRRDTEQPNSVRFHVEQQEDVAPARQPSSSANTPAPLTPKRGKTVQRQSSNVAVTENPVSTHTISNEQSAKFNKSAVSDRASSQRRAIHKDDEQSDSNSDNEVEEHERGSVLPSAYSPRDHDMAPYSIHRINQESVTSSSESQYLAPEEDDAVNIDSEEDISDDEMVQIQTSRHHRDKYTQQDVEEEDDECPDNDDLRSEDGEQDDEDDYGEDDSDYSGIERRTGNQYISESPVINPTSRSPAYFGRRDSKLPFHSEDEEDDEDGGGDGHSGYEDEDEDDDDRYDANRRRKLQSGSRPSSRPPKRFGLLNIAESDLILDQMQHSSHLEEGDNEYDEDDDEDGEDHYDDGEDDDEEIQEEDDIRYEQQQQQRLHRKSSGSKYSGHAPHQQHRHQHETEDDDDDDDDDDTGNNDGVRPQGEEDDEEVDLIYDPMLNLYFDPKTGKYYAAKQ